MYRARCTARVEGGAMVIEDRDPRRNTMSTIGPATAATDAAIRCRALRHDPASPYGLATLRELEEFTLAERVRWADVNLTAAQRVVSFLVDRIPDPANIFEDVAVDPALQAMAARHEASVPGAAFADTGAA